MDLKKSENYISAHRDEIIANMCKFLLTDTLLFWSDNQDLHAYQKEHWQPILNELNSVFKLNLQITNSFTPANNDDAAENFSKIAGRFSDKELTACFLASLEMKSVLLGLLFVNQKISASDALKSAFLEELYQNKFWGEDVAALNARETVLHNLEKIAEFINNGKML